ncbi:hypothetical protein EDD16DRAFT_1520555 [Pisolithus croceorrhizus]|nr:hypothetical protein EDD16DRAFT_1520555 [Pisolithus croceorrhizus]
MSLKLTIEARILHKGPEGVRKWCSVNMNVSSQIRGPEGQDKANKRLGVIKGIWKFLNNGKRIEMDGPKCQMDGTMSSTCCSSKQAKMKLLAEEKIGQDQQQQHKLRDIPEPPKRLGMHTYEPTRLKHPCGQIKLESIKVRRTWKGKNTYQGPDNAIACPQEGIGTL